MNDGESALGVRTVSVPIFDRGVAPGPLRNLLMLGVRLMPSGHEGAMTKSRSRRSWPPAVVHDLSATINDRRARGRAARKRARRGGLGHWEERDRGHDALSTILAQNKIRVPELVPIRHYRMAVSP